MNFFFNLKPLTVTLLDIEPMMGALDGVVMELQDSAFPLLRGVLYMYLFVISSVALLRSQSKVNMLAALSM